MDGFGQPLRRSGRWLSVILLLSGLWTMLANAQGASVFPAPAPPGVARASSAMKDSVSAVRAVEAFRVALAKGDSVAVLALLAPDVIVVESGVVERLTDYRQHHLPADIAFARAVPGVHTLVSAHTEGNTAWVTSTSIAQGQFEGRAVNSAGAELIVLTRARADAGWRIRAIHWSSHRRAP